MAHINTAVICTIIVYFTKFLRLFYKKLDSWILMTFTTLEQASVIKTSFRWLPYMNLNV